MSGPTATRAGDGVPLFWLAAVLLRERRLILRLLVLGTFVALAVALLRPARYTTTFTFLPQKTDEEAPGAIAALAGQFGIDIGANKSEESPEFYTELVHTRRVLLPIATAVVAPGNDSTALLPLADYLKVKGSTPAIQVDKTIEKLRKKVISTSVAKRTTGVATVRVTTKSPEVSLDIAERLITGLTDYNLRTRQSQAREERRFTEERLEAAGVALREAEDELQRFLQANQRGDSPALTFRRERLERAVRLHEQVVMTLAQKYEENRIREVRDTPVLTVIEVPVLAPRPDRRGRAVILAVGIAISLALAVAVAILRTLWTRDDRATDPSLALLRDEWGRLRGTARP